MAKRKSIILSFNRTHCTIAVFLDEGMKKKMCEFTLNCKVDKKDVSIPYETKGMIKEAF